MPSDDGWDWMREEWRDARDTQYHRSHAIDCPCTECRYTEGDER